LKGKTEGWTNVTKEATERNMDLSVIVFIKTATSGDKLGLDGAANQFWYRFTSSQTWHVSLAVVHARKTAAWMSTRKMASTKICEGLVKLPSACSCIRGCSFPFRTGAIVSSPVFVGENLARFGAAISSLKKNVYGLLRFIR
jgi:hypothetical protein